MPVPVPSPLRPADDREVRVARDARNARAEARARSDSLGAALDAVLRARARAGVAVATPAAVADEPALAGGAKPPHIPSS
ncbi:MAG: hypothetical protein JXB39_03115 [Deltaproteobacteria bacterium]|nr:hypothetical protein [Deltaproteobacteria bacterium]